MLCHTRYNKLPEKIQFCKIVGVEISREDKLFIDDHNALA